MSDNANKMRDRLVKLLQKRSCFYNKSKCNSRCSNCDYVTIDDDDISNLADYLLANDVDIRPCKVGDTVYQVDTLFDETTITELTVVELIIDSKGIRSLYGMTNKGSVYCFNRGYTLNDIKFTKEEAERALKGGAPICDYTKTDWNDCCECSAKDYCDKYNERSEIIGEMLGEVIGEIKNERR